MNRSRWRPRSKGCDHVYGVPRCLTTCCIDGAGAIGLLEPRSNPVDLVICDLVMPVLGGKEVAEWMRQHAPAVPLLFISGYPRAYLEAHHLFDPGVPMLRKPFLPSRLLEAVEEQVASHPPIERRRAQRTGETNAPSP